MIFDQDGKPAIEETVMPPLDERQEQEAQDRTSVEVLVVHEAIRKDGEEELRRPTAALAWSGLAAGLSMGFSTFTQAILAAHLPATSWAPLIISLGYPAGFLMVILGRQQLFTENTLTAIIPLLAKRNLRMLLSVLRMWTIVLAANLTGSLVFAWVLNFTPVLRPEVKEALKGLTLTATQFTFGTALMKGIFAGWLIAMVVWMNAATDSGRISIIVIFTYVVGLANLTHIVAGSTEAAYLAWAGLRPWSWVAGGYILPTLIGNILGGVSLVSAVNHAQVIAGAKKGKA